MALPIDIKALKKEDKNVLEELKQIIGVGEVIGVWDGIHGMIFKCEVSMTNSRLCKSTIESLNGIDRFRWIETDNKIISVGF